MNQVVLINSFNNYLEPVIESEEEESEEEDEPTMPVISNRLKVRYVLEGGFGALPFESYFQVVQGKICTLKVEFLTRVHNPSISFG